TPLTTPLSPNGERERTEPLARTSTPRSSIVATRLWISAYARMAGKSWLLQRNCARRAPQKGGGEGVKVPAQISRQPPQHLEAGAAVLALDPRHRHLRDLPAEAMRLHQQLDAVAETFARLDCNPLDRAAREQAKAI